MAPLKRRALWRLDTDVSSSTLEEVAAPALCLKRAAPFASKAQCAALSRRVLRPHKADTAQQVAVMLRGDVGTEVALKFLETRKVKLTMERCVFLNDGTPSVGIRWKDGSSEMIVEGMMPGYQGFGECQCMHSPSAHPLAALTTRAYSRISAQRCVPERRQAADTLRARVCAGAHAY